MTGKKEKKITSLAPLFSVKHSVSQHMMRNPSAEGNIEWRCRAAATCRSCINNATLDDRAGTILLLRPKDQQQKFSCVR